MSFLKCKMCGGDLNIKDGESVCECEYCGTLQTIPFIDNEKKFNLFNRANRLRMNAEYDRGASVYESITVDFPEEAEAYWGLCLCKYGIEYVDDPLTGTKIPTCHRTLSESIFDDTDFIQACENASVSAKRIYREEAKVIDQLQQKILEIVTNEDPYDVFICYKELDDDGNRTEDSVLAHDIYDELSNKGLKVFFARVTLEDKLGQEYEPYIYSALHSSKVMLSIGTQFEYFDAVWVKNEWSRFLDMMKHDRTKVLIPCFKGIDAYDMPREYKNLQAQDMGKLGWLQDLTRGVLKLCGKTGASSENGRNQTGGNIQTANPTVQSLLQRSYIFLEDGAWKSAEEYAERVLDIEPVNADAYLAKLLSDLHVKKIADLGNLEKPFSNNQNYIKILRYGNANQKVLVQDYNDAVEKREKHIMFEKALRLYKNARSLEDYVEAEKELENVSDIENANELLEKCRNTITVLKNHSELKKKAEEQIEELTLKYEEQEKEYLNKCDKLNTISKQALKTKTEKESEEQIVNSLKKESSNLQGVFKAKQRKEIENEILSRQNTIHNLDKAFLELSVQYDAISKNSIVAPNEYKYHSDIGHIYYTLGLYPEAFSEYSLIKDEADIDNFLKTDMHMCEEASKLSNVVSSEFFSKGNIVKFGNYWKTAEKTKEKIEWIVIDVRGNESVLISKESLDCKKYHEQLMPVTWKECSLRTWLNSVFLNNAFSEEEQKSIISIKVNNGKDQGRKDFVHTDGGANTYDKVFLLSYSEVMKYFPSEKDRLCTSTLFCRQAGVQVMGNGNCPWLLRSPGIRQSLVSIVEASGTCDDVRVDFVRSGVRPVICVKTDTISIT